MNLRRILGYAAAFAAVAAAAAVCVVAASFALYALARMYVGPPAAAAVVAGVFALVALIVAWIATRKVAPRVVAGAKPQDSSLMDRVITLAKERPLVALGAAAAAATVLLRNPTVVSALIGAFLSSSASKPRK